MAIFSLQLLRLGGCDVPGGGGGLKDTGWGQEGRRAPDPSVCAPATRADFPIQGLLWLRTLGVGAPSAGATVHLAK